MQKKTVLICLLMNIQSFCMNQGAPLRRNSNQPAMISSEAIGSITKQVSRSKIVFSAPLLSTKQQLIADKLFGRDRSQDLITCVLFSGDVTLCCEPLSEDHYALLEKLYDERDDS